MQMKYADTQTSLFVHLTLLANKGNHEAGVTGEIVFYGRSLDHK
jgi:hypothetical protein